MILVNYRPDISDREVLHETDFDDCIFRNIPVSGDKNVMSQFSTTVDKIEDLRASGAQARSNNSQIYPKRVKPTVNNPVSSRAKIIYDFMFKFTKENGDNRCVSDGVKYMVSPLVIDDTPGAENL